jgi:L-asparagine oxygenase
MTALIAEDIDLFINLIMIDNKRAVHGRSSFKAYYDGQDRYLQRLFITKDLTRAQSIFSKKERIITYSF